MGIIIKRKDGLRLKKKAYLKKVTHKHIDERGFAFGKAHALDTVHKKSSTQIAHNRTKEKI